MDINSSHSKPSKASVRFENSEERYTFARNAPLFSTERLKSVAWDAQSFWLLTMPAAVCWNKEFPQTQEIPHAVIGHVASVLAEKSEQLEAEITITEADILAATSHHMRELLLGVRSRTTS